jgi:hypothetical protein
MVTCHRPPLPQPDHQAKRTGTSLRCSALGSIARANGTSTPCCRPRGVGNGLKSPIGEVSRLGNARHVFHVSMTMRMVDRWPMPNHPPKKGKSPFVSSRCRAVTSAIGEELRARYQLPNQVSHELRWLLRQIRCSTIRHSQPRRPHEMWLTDDEPRRIAEISLHFLSS